MRNVVLVPHTCTLVRLAVATSIMSSNVQVSSSTTNFQPIFDEALKEYKKKTGKELASHPLAEEIKSCDTPEAVLAVLQGKADELNQYRSGDGQLTKWLTPAVNVLNALSPTLGAGVGMVSSSMLPIIPFYVLTLTVRYFPLPQSFFLESVSSLWWVFPLRRP